MAHFFPCTYGITYEETTKNPNQGEYPLIGLCAFLSVAKTRDLLVLYGTHFNDA
jgi:hypothetical protein